MLINVINSPNSCVLRDVQLERLYNKGFLAIFYKEFIVSLMCLELMNAKKKQAICGNLVLKWSPKICWPYKIDVGVSYKHDLKTVQIYFVVIESFRKTFHCHCCLYLNAFWVKSDLVEPDSTTKFSFNMGTPLIRSRMQKPILNLFEKDCQSSEEAGVKQNWWDLFAATAWMQAPNQMMSLCTQKALKHNCFTQGLMRHYTLLSMHYTRGPK